MIGIVLSPTPSPQRECRADSSFVLLTAAHNEEANIGATVRSVLAQTAVPQKWIIVSDNSNDRTAEVVECEASGYDFVEVIAKKDLEQKPSFASKVFALRFGYEQLRGLSFEFIGILDADVTLEPLYYEKMLRKFRVDPDLGIAGGFIHEVRKGRYESRPFNSIRSVAGGIQLLRRECYEGIGGYLPIRSGGEDWVAEVMAKMKGWKVRSFPEILAYHNRKGGEKRGLFKECYGQGRRAYTIGSHPVYEIFKLIHRLSDHPYVVASCIRLFGYIGGYLSREERMVPRDFVEYLRVEQTARIRSLRHYRSDRGTVQSD
jgi:poly-beta-1,6-N-acetyl-D-glucosamine synthase